ncbi:hypothetical protein [Bacillus subtilis]|uniref:hypothetical protein n=1 Tax=Bacillus subtilis TaxID=1423 RepID=UPI00140494CF|nr:hypothetical protein [Bacillus subtilis]MBT2165557.1 hypothetical protein [Bacillus subtilis]MDQ1876646.1 hypothetical protein [Bacillus subtilis]QIR16692.1 hypothetical protein F0366_12275 [Bacillus subtilis]UZJ50316.1 hypothetical protein OOZ27_10430 [Bacillus subtilis]CAF1855089.1 hypothetical protein NRS6160_03884 [Bacillus subtilis]
MKRVILKENMIDDNELVIFEAGISYVVADNAITNENEITVPLKDIWVDFETVKEGAE